MEQGEVTKEINKNIIKQGEDESLNEEHTGSKKDDESEARSEGTEDEANELEEPALKYIRLTSGTFDQYLKGDAASAIVVGDKVLGVGTHSGNLYILDVMGNMIKSIQCHTTTINSISMDSTEQYMASASDDGCIVVHGIYTNFKQVKNYMRPVKAIALSPDFATNSNQRMLSGGLAGQLIMNAKGWLGYNDTILPSDDGPILEIKWRGKYVAWASDSGVKIYDTESNQRISFISRAENSPRPDLYTCHLYWKNDSTLFIGWADTFKIVKIMTHDPSLHPHILSQLPKVEIDYILKTDFIISGVSCLNDSILLLAYNGDIIYQDSELNSSKPPSAPELRMVDKTTGQDVADVLTMTGYQKFKSGDYKLVTTSSQDLFYIMSPKDLICVKQRELDDRIEWFLENEKYAEALQLLKENHETNTKYTITKVGKMYMKYLLVNQDYELVAQLCPEILANDKKQWELWISAFYKSEQLKYIAQYIPSREVVLSSTVYEMVLGYFLKQDLNIFFKLIRTWPIKNYNLNSIVKLALDQLQSYDNEDSEPPTLLLQVLAELYQLENEPEKAMEYLLRLKSPTVFRLINEHKLYNAIQDKVKSIMEYDVLQYNSIEEYQKAGVQVTSELKAVSMLVRNITFIPIEQVVNQLYDFPILLHNYLHALFKKDPSLAAKWHDIQVELYAEFDYPLLMVFLKSSNDYSLNKAYKSCEIRQLIPEMIFILSRMGEHFKALKLILNSLDDVEKAIDYAKEHDEQELWMSLLEHSKDKPMFLKALLEKGSPYLAPSKVIQAIPKGLKIPEMKQSILKILKDYQLQMSLRKGCHKVILRDSYMLSKTWKKNQIKALDLSMENLTCWNCLDSLDNKQLVIALFCGHIYHASCLNVNLENADVNASYMDLKFKLKDQNITCIRCNELSGNNNLVQSTSHLPSNQTSPIQIDSNLPPMVQLLP